MTQRKDSRCIFSEGSIAVPPEYLEQTVNILVSGQRPSLNISRDRLGVEDSFDAWIANQRRALQKGLRKFELLEEQPTALGAGLVPGMTFLYRYSPQKGVMQYQRQAAFLISDAGILIFTVVSAKTLTEQDDAFFAHCLGSYQRS